MALDISLASFVRISSSVLLGALAVLILAMQPRDARIRWLALSFLSFTPTSILVNVGIENPATGPQAFGAAALSMLLGSAALAAHLAIDAREDRRTVLRVVWLAGAIAVISAVSILLAPRASAGPAGGFFGAADAIGRCAIGAVAYLYARRARLSIDASPHAPGWAWLALGLSLFPVASAAIDVPRAATTGGPFALASLVLPTLVFAATTFELTRLAPLARPVPALSAVLIPAIGVAALAVQTLVRADVGDRGIVRGITLPIFAYAIFRFDLLKSGRDRRWVPSAVLGPTLLAVLFIVAQIAQNFFAAQYGLILGGLIAGVLLVAARPIERALESDRGRAPKHAVARERSFRAAARKFHRTDGYLTRDEERELMVLAEHLGISAARAYEIRDEIERDARAN